MPTYDYECAACGHAFERFQSITAPAVRKCPSCGKNRARRRIGAGAGIIFKGSGFYCTDYRSDSYKRAAEKEKPAASGEPAKAASTAGTEKPAGKTSKAPAPKE